MKNTTKAVRLLTCGSLLTVVALLAGCASNQTETKAAAKSQAPSGTNSINRHNIFDRYALLKEYGPTVPQKAGSPLKGIKVSVITFSETFGIDDKWPDIKTFEPNGYKYRKLTPEQKKMWERDFAARKSSSSKKDWKEIGFIRNSYGMTMGKIYLFNPPGEWLADTLKLDLQEQGSQVVDGSLAGDASVSIEGTIRYFKIEMDWVDLVVDLQLKVKDKPPIQRTFHTATRSMAWVDSTTSHGIYYRIRQCQQKFSAAVIDELEKDLRQQEGSGK